MSLSLLCLSPHRPGSALGAPSWKPLPAPSAHYGDGREVECRRKPGTQWAALPFGSATRTDVPQPRPQHRAYAVWFPALQGPTAIPAPQPPLSRVGLSAPGHRRQRQPPPGRQPQGRPQRARCVVGEPRVPRRAAGEEGEDATASGPFAGLDWQQAGLRAAGARRTTSDSGSGQMSCCLSTARAAAQHFAFIISRIIGLNLIYFQRCLQRVTWIGLLGLTNGPRGVKKKKKIRHFLANIRNAFPLFF